MQGEDPWFCFLVCVVFLWMEQHFTWVGEEDEVWNFLIPSPFEVICNLESHGEKIRWASWCSNCCILQNMGLEATSAVLMPCATAGRQSPPLLFITSRTRVGRRKHKYLFLSFALFLSETLIQKLLFIITSIKPWDSILASSILLLTNRHF